MQAKILTKKLPIYIIIYTGIKIQKGDDEL